MAAGGEGEDGLPKTSDTVGGKEPPTEGAKTSNNNAGDNQNTISSKSDLNNSNRRGSEAQSTPPSATLNNNNSGTKVDVLGKRLFKKQPQKQKSDENEIQVLERVEAGVGTAERSTENPKQVK